MSTTYRNYKEKERYPPVKITFVGDAMVGKTSLVHRFLRDEFLETTCSTIGAAFVTMRFSLKQGEQGRLYHIWDTAGQERFSSLIPLYVSGAQVIVVVYDISNRYSFERLTTHWLKYIRQNLRLGDDEALPMIYLLGNKRDLSKSNRQVFEDEAQQFAKAHDMGFLEVSAKTGEGAKEVFCNIAKHADDLVIRQADTLKLSRADLEVKGDEGATGCCSGAIGYVTPIGW